MALQFNAGDLANPYAYQNSQQTQFDNLNQTLEGITAKEQQNRQFMMQQAIRQAAENREQGTYNLQNNPLVPSSPSAPSDGSSMPSFSTGTTDQNPLSLFQGGGIGSQGPQQTSQLAPQQNVSPIVQQYLQDNPHLAAFSPYGGGTSQPSQPQSSGSFDPEQPYLDILKNPSESPARQQLASQAIARLTSEANTPIELAQMRANLAKTQAEAQAAGGISPEDWQDMQTNNSAGIAARHNGIIPPKISEQMASMTNQSSNRGVTIIGKYQPQIQKEQANLNSLDSSIQGIQSGDAGQIESAQGIVSSALKLSPRLAKEAGGQSYLPGLSAESCEG